MKLALNRLISFIVALAMASDPCRAAIPVSLPPSKAIHQLAIFHTDAIPPKAFSAPQHRLGMGASVTHRVWHAARSPLSDDTRQTRHLTRPGKLIEPLLNKPILRRLPKTITLNRLHQLQSRYDRLSQRQSYDLSDHEQEAWLPIIQQLTGFRNVKLVKNAEAGTRVSWMENDMFHLKHTALYHGNPKDLVSDLALITAHEQAEVWVAQHPQAVRVRVLRRIAVILIAWLIPPAKVEEGSDTEFVVNVLMFAMPSLYVAIRRRVRTIAKLPALSLETIKAASRLPENQKAQWDHFYKTASAHYDREGQQPRTHKTNELSDCSRIAWMVADNGAATEAIGAALASRMQGRALDRISNQLAEHPTRIQTLVSALNAMKHLSWDPDIPTTGADYSVQNWTNRVIMAANDLLADEVGKTIKDETAQKTEIDALLPSLIHIFLADQYQQIVNLTDQSSAQTIQTWAIRSDVILAPLAERIGLSDTAAMIRNEMLRREHPDKYDRIRTRYRERLGLDHEAAERMLMHWEDMFYHEATGALVEEEDPSIIIRSREKSYASAYGKELEDPNNPIETQNDLLALMMVVSDADDLDRVRQRLETQFGYNVGPAWFKFDTRRTWATQENRTGYQLINFEFPNPEIPGKTVTAELQLMTQEYYKLYLSGMSPIRYGRAHWTMKAKRAVDLRFMKRSKPGSVDGQQFDHQDELLTGDFATDIVNIRNGLTSFCFPAVRREHPPWWRSLFKPSASRGQNLPTHRALKLNKADGQSPIIADALLHGPIGGSPDAHCQAFHEAHDHSTRTLLALDAAIRSSDEILLSTKADKKMSPEKRAELAARVMTPAARYALTPTRPDSATTSASTELLNDWSDTPEGNDVLNDIASWMGFSDKSSFVSAAKADQALQQQVQSWIHDRYVKVTMGNLQGREGERGKYRLTVNFDQHVPNAEAHVIATLRELGWKTEMTMTKQTKGRTLACQFLIEQNSIWRGVSVEQAKTTLRNRIEHLQLRREVVIPWQDRRLFHVHLILQDPNASGEALDAILQQIRKTKLPIELISCRAASNGWMLNVAVPDTVKNSLIGDWPAKLQDELFNPQLGVIDRVDIRIPPISDVIVADLDRFIMRAAQNRSKESGAPLELPFKFGEKLPSSPPPVFSDRRFWQEFRQLWGIMRTSWKQRDAEHYNARHAPYLALLWHALHTLEIRDEAGLKSIAAALTLMDKTHWLEEVYRRLPNLTDSDAEAISTNANILQMPLLRMSQLLDHVPQSVTLDPKAQALRYMMDAVILTSRPDEALATRILQAFEIVNEETVFISRSPNSLAPALRQAQLVILTALVRFIGDDENAINYLSIYANRIQDREHTIQTWLSVLREPETRQAILTSSFRGDLTNEAYDAGLSKLEALKTAERQPRIPPSRLQAWERVRGLWMAVAGALIALSLFGLMLYPTGYWQMLWVAAHINIYTTVLYAALGTLSFGLLCWAIYWYSSVMIHEINGHLAEAQRLLSEGKLRDVNHVYLDRKGDDWKIMGIYEDGSHEINDLRVLEAGPQKSKEALQLARAVLGAALACGLFISYTLSSMSTLTQAPHAWIILYALLIVICGALVGVNWSNAWADRIQLKFEDASNRQPYQMQMVMAGNQPGTLKTVLGVIRRHGLDIETMKMRRIKGGVRLSFVFRSTQSNIVIKRARADLEKLHFAPDSRKPYGQRVLMRLPLEDKPGAFASVAGELSGKGINIESARVDPTQPSKAQTEMVLTIPRNVDLQSFLKNHPATEMIPLDMNEATAQASIAFLEGKARTLPQWHIQERTLDSFLAIPGRLGDPTGETMDGNIVQNVKIAYELAEHFHPQTSTALDLDTYNQSQTHQATRHEWPPSVRQKRNFDAQLPYLAHPASVAINRLRRQERNVLVVVDTLLHDSIEEWPDSVLEWIEDRDPDQPERETLLALDSVRHRTHVALDPIIFSASDNKQNEGWKNKIEESIDRAASVNDLRNRLRPLLVTLAEQRIRDHLMSYPETIITDVSDRLTKRPDVSADDYSRNMTTSEARRINRTKIEENLNNLRLLAKNPQKALAKALRDITPLVMQNLMDPDADHDNGHIDLLQRYITELMRQCLNGEALTEKSFAESTKKPTAAQDAILQVNQFMHWLWDHYTPLGLSTETVLEFARYCNRLVDDLGTRKVLHAVAGSGSA